MARTKRAGARAERRSTAMGSTRSRVPAVDFMEQLGELKFMEVFHFSKRDFRRLATALQVPESFELPSGRRRRAGPKCLLYVLWRLHSPTTLALDGLLWGEKRHRLRDMFDTTVTWLFDTWTEELVSSLCVDAVRPKCRRFAAAIHARGAPLDRCWGFIGGPAARISGRVVRHQDAYYGWQESCGGHFQCIATPDGIQRQVFGPLPSRGAAPTIEAELMPALRRRFNSPNGMPYYLYGGVACGFALSPWLLHGYGGGGLEGWQQEFNRLMGRVDETASWTFANLVDLWALEDVSTKHRLLESTCDEGMVYAVAALLGNCQTCLYGSDTSEYFDCEPPALEDYLNGSG